MAPRACCPHCAPPRCRTCGQPSALFAQCSPCVVREYEAALTPEQRAEQEVALKAWHADMAARE